MCETGDCLLCYTLLNVCGVVYRCMGVWVYVCMGICIYGCWVYVCMGVCVYGCMGTGCGMQGVVKYK